MENIKLTIRYDGNKFNGFQRQAQQPNSRTVQQILEEAFSALYKEEVIVIGAGRTDKGVHAKNQVCNIKVKGKIPIEKIPLAVNSLLPSDLSVMKTELVEDEFHSRYSAKGKIYKYQILSHKVRDPFIRNNSWHVPIPLNLEEMQKATKYFVGTHNFKAFCSAKSGKSDFIRTIEWLKIDKQNNIISITIKGNGFLYNMVRIIVGTLVDIGHGKYPHHEVKAILESQERKRSGATAPAHGLCLEEIIY